MTTTKYKNWSHEQLLHEYKELLKRKKFGIVWEDKLETVSTQSRDFLPVLEKDDNKTFFTDKENLNHIFIEGDNYHTLSILNYTHKKKIDLIFIDPPYNTGSSKWIYNNDYVDREDRFRHSKWLSFMSKRLRLAKSLLKDTGFIAVTIDNNELFTLGLLMDEIFGEDNRIAIVTVVHKPEGRNQEKFFGTSNEFMLVYARDIFKAKFSKVVLDPELMSRFNEEDEEGRYRLKNFIRLTDGKYSLRENKPHFFYPIYISTDLKKFSLEKLPSYYEVFPITNKGVERTWKTTKETFNVLASAGSIVAKKENGNITVYEKLREDQVIKTHWIRKEYHAYHFGTKLLEEILGDKRFEFPKSLYLMVDIVKLMTSKDATILDFFAGSGTTGHAILQLNKEDGGNRRFILCTNNENNNGSTDSGIAESVCYPRIKNVMNGYKTKDSKDVDGLGGNLLYYKTKLIDNIKTDNDKRTFILFCGDMLSMAEETYNRVEFSENEYAIYSNKNKVTAILFDEDVLGKFKKLLEKFNNPVVVYIFSYDHNYDENDFLDIKRVECIKPVPEVIINIYRKIFREVDKPKNK